MAATQGGSKVLQASFYESTSGPAVSPDSLSLDITFEEISVLDAPVTWPGGDIVQINSYGFQYSWVIPYDAEIGTYSATWTAIIDGEEAAGTETFEVITQEQAESAVLLGADFELVFTGGMTPLYIDPEELSLFFPDVDLIDIAEQIHYASIFAMDYLDDDGQVTPLMIEYVQATSACALSRLYDPTGMSGMGTGAESVTLGDLSVKEASSFTTIRQLSDVNRGNVTSWCELAALLRKELLRSKGTAGMRSTRKASIYSNPIPSRAIRRWEK